MSGFDPQPRASSLASGGLEEVAQRMMDVPPPLPDTPSSDAPPSVADVFGHHGVRDEEPTDTSAAPESEAPLPSDAPAAPEPEAPLTSDAPHPVLVARLDALAAQVLALQRLFETRILRSEAEGQVNAKLHAELQAHKNDLYGKLVKPILADVITVREHVIKLVDDHRQRSPEQGVSLATFESFSEDLAQILEDNEVEVHHSVPGAQYDSRWHQVVGKVDTLDPAANRTVATVRGDAYSFQGRALARQRVTVFTLRPSETGDPQ